ncbi:MAG TPA: response regulator transcription factor [Herbaspirillum sp.]|jgi:two-component system capsular synthesis response regulator RcsB
MHGRQTKLLIADDHPVMLLGIKSILQSVSNTTLVGTAENSTDLFAMLEREQVDVVLTDYAMPGGDFGDGMVMLERLRARFPDLKVIVFTVLTSPALLSKIMQLQVHGILSKGSDLNEIPIALQRVASGMTYFSRDLEDGMAAQNSGPCIDKITLLSKRELEVLRMFLGGMSVQAIALHLRRSSKTVSNQKRMAMLKLACANDAELFLWHSQAGLTDVASAAN